MAKIFDCKGCGGDVDANDFQFPPGTSGCTISKIKLVCSRCGLLHWPDGTVWFLKVFFRDGKFVQKEHI